MTDQTTTTKRKWPWILVAGIVAAALVVVISVIVTKGGATPQASAAPTGSTSSPSTNVAEESPTGCLGGTARNAEMITQAQRQAPHTSNGAVEVAAAFVRWSHQYPYPSAADANVVSKIVLGSTWPTSDRDLAAFFATDPNASGGTVDDGVTYHFTTVNGVWYLESYSDAKATISLGTGVVVTNALSPTLQWSSTLTMLWEDGEWKVGGEGVTRSTETIFQIGQPFTDGC
jgi:hypothetical protein